MKLKFLGLYLSYAALTWVVLVLFFWFIHPMQVSTYLFVGIALAIVGAVVQVGVSVFDRLARISKQ